MEVGVLDEADGSAMVETGNTRVVASSIRTSEASPKTPTGIRPCSNQDAVQHGSFLSRRPNETRTKPEAKEIGLVAKKALEPAVELEEFPKAGIDISMEILESDGGTRVTGINAAALALADAGIPMKGMVSATASGIVDDYSCT